MLSKSSEAINCDQLFIHTRTMNNARQLVSDLALSGLNFNYLLSVANKSDKLLRMFPMLQYDTIP